MNLFILNKSLPLFCWFLTIVNPASCSLESMILNDQWPQETQRPHVVFDIDDTLCKKIPNGKSISRDMHKRSPETILIPFLTHGEEKIYTHAFFPGMAELFLSILTWGWNIDCFSSGDSNRNETVIPIFLKVAFSPYFEEPDRVVEHVMRNRMRVYSRANMTFYKSGNNINNYKKDLRILKIPLEHTILIDDDGSFAVDGEQLPPICVSKAASEKFAHYLAGNYEALSSAGMGLDARENACFLLGILSRARKLMESGLSLRTAVQKLRALPSRFSKYWGHDHYSDDCPRPKEGYKDKSTRYEHEQVLGFMRTGRSLIQELRTQRLFKIQSEKSDDSYTDLIKEIYGSAEYEEGEDHGCILM